jgi:hypothetical protein
MSVAISSHRFLMSILLLCVVPACAPARPGAATADSAQDQATPASRKDPPIDRAQVEAAQTRWCEALLEIGKAGATGGDARALATKVLSSAYDYDTGTVLFKPTLAFGDKTFRMTKPGALAYFVGGDAAFAEDQGLALRQWTKCRPEVAGMFANRDVAIAMGNVHLESAKGDKVS